MSMGTLPTLMVLKLIRMYWLMELNRGPPNSSMDKAGRGFSALSGQVPTKNRPPKSRLPSRLMNLAEPEGVRVTFPGHICPGMGTLMVAPPR